MHLADALIATDSVFTNVWRLLVATASTLFFLLLAYLTVRPRRQFHRKGDRWWTGFAMVVELGVAAQEFYFVGKPLFYPRLALAMIANIVLAVALFVTFHRQSERLLKEIIELEHEDAPLDDENGFIKPEPDEFRKM